jgi:hypothetical protein
MVHGVTRQYHTMRYSRLIMLMTIKHTEVPSCVNCKFHQPQHYTTFDSPLSDCHAVGEMNVITGKVDYVSVGNCRRYECGVNGKLYEPEPNLFLKKIKHALYRSLQYSPLLVYVVFLCYMCLSL